MKRRRILAAILMAAGCRTADLRPEGLRQREPTPAEIARGIRLLRQATDAQGGMDAWNRSETSAVWFHDQWRGLVGRCSSPWPALGNDVELRWRRDGTYSEARFLDGPEAGAHWRLEQGRTTRLSAIGARDTDQHEPQRFILAAYPHLMELPFRLLREATRLAWIGERRHRGRDYDLVLATWTSFAPQRSADQFVLWIDLKNHRLALAEYTPSWTSTAGRQVRTTSRTFSGWGRCRSPFATPSRLPPGATPSSAESMCRRRARMRLDSR